MRRDAGRWARQRSVVAFRRDLVRTLGLRHAVRRVAANAQHRRALVNRRDRVPDAMWRDAAAELGADVIELAPTLLEFRLGDAFTRIRGQTTPFADPVSDQVASDKSLAYRLLADADLPIPRHRLIDVKDISAALEFLEATDEPCIVKPARGAGGSGVTGEVRSARQMQRALTSAGRFHDQALLEQQASGDSFRLLILDGEVLDVIKRPRPQVLGDGQSTIEQLMFSQYHQRIRDDGPSGLKPLTVDLDCLFTVQQAGFTITSVPRAGQPVTIKTATNYNGPRESVTLQPPYPPPFVDLARRAASALGVRLGGVDLVSESPGSAVVLEVNAVPGLTHHYNVSGGPDAPRIATVILAALLDVRRLDKRPPEE